MLALSDQQLVTGLAMLVAALARYSSITVYSMNVVMALVFFSSIVHLATLDIITSELRRNKLLKGIRVVLMLITLLFLVFVLILQLSSTWTVRSRQSDLFLICALPHFGLNDFFLVVSIFAVIIPLCVAYYEKFWRLYAEVEEPSCSDIPLLWWQRRYGIDPVEDRVTQYKRRALEPIYRSGSRTTIAIRGWLLVESYIFNELCNSRAGAIANLLAANVYGSARIFMARQESEGTSGPFNTMGFGQIVPLALLILPVFTAIESVSGSYASACI
jgi:hypothetical protein